MKKIKLKNNSKKKSYKRSIFKLFLFVLLFYISYSLTFNYLNKKNIDVRDKKYVDYLLENSYNNKNSKILLKEGIKLVSNINLKDPKTLLDSKIKNNPNIHIEEKILPQIEIGDKENPTIIVIGRQHPGETLSSFFLEGMIEEIIENKLKYHFLIYPIVNQEGVKNGNHRYFNETDYNRSWNKQDAPQEIKYIREIVKKTKPEYFIDVHNDEISSKDYVTMKSNITEIGGIQVLKPRSTIKRFIRAIIKQHKIINPRLKTAREYIQQEYNCKSILIELSMNKEYTKAKNKGKKFIIDLLKERN